MSRFFRSADSSSSSEDEAEDQTENSSKSASVTNSQDDETDGALPQVSSLSLSGQKESGPLSQPLHDSTSHHKDFLIHALLEDYSLNATLKARPGARPDAPHIQTEARETYRHLVTQLGSLNVVPDSFGEDRYAATRQGYLKGLSVLSRQHSNVAVPSGVRGLLTDGSVDAGQPLASLLPSQPSSHGLQSPLTLNAPLRRLLGHSGFGDDVYSPWGSDSATPPTLGLVQHGVQPETSQTRYRSDFEELRILGRGGYGIVYRARNRLDNQEYAVKKVPLSPARLHRIRTRGQSEVDEILLELRTLARLHHPNIVRYYNAWVEWADASPSSGVGSFGQSSDVTHTQDAVAGAQDPRARSLQRIFTEDEDVGDDIVFEHSDTTEAFASEGSGSTSVETSGGGQLRRTRTRSTTATVSDDTVESINREAEISASIQSTADGAHFAQPTLAIHIQMSLHPLTLADLLSSNNEADDCIQHCYHLEPSIGIATAVLDGLEYLHDEGVIHRDIKPANIFLSPTKARRPKRNGVDLRQCRDCEHAGASATLELGVCIGDFGLAAVASPETDVHVSSAASPVGTAVYRPTQAEAQTASLDIYALGIVLFELLWKFETRMERHHILHELKEGKYPEGFCERVGKGRGVRTMECIDCMLARDETQSVGFVDVRERLAALVATTVEGT